jgi:DNA-binding transcriptional LysR family regulator
MRNLAMNPLQIEYFLSVARTKSVAQSARELFVSAPAISKQLAALERDLDVTLLTRSHSGMSLTPAGQEYYEFFAKTFTELNAIKQRYVEKKTATLKFSLGVFKDWPVYDRLHKLEQRLKQIFPGLTLTIQPLAMPELVEGLEQQRLDMILCMPNSLLAPKMATLTETKLCTIQKMLVYANYLLDSQHPSVKDFAQQTLFSIANPSQKAALADDAMICEHYGVEPKVVPTDNLDATLAKVAMGKGVTIVDKWSVYRYFPELSGIPLDFDRKVCLFAPQQNDDSLQHTIAMILKDIF